MSLLEPIGPRSCATTGFCRCSSCEAMRVATWGQLQSQDTTGSQRLATWMEGRMEPNDLQPDVESEREKAAYRRGYAAGRAVGEQETRKAIHAALTVGEGYREVASYGTDPTWPVPGASER